MDFQTLSDFDRENGFRLTDEQPLWRQGFEFTKRYGRSLCSRQGLLKAARRRVPIISWIRKYKIRNLMADIIAGITVGIYNVPQGMAYSVLASLPPVYGLYASFFPPLIYAILGTGFHTSIGVFSITCMMIGHARTSLLPDGTTEYAGIKNLQPVDLVAALSFTTGIIQLAMWLFRLEFLTAYMSDAVVNGFMFGAAIHSARSQIPSLLGIKVPNRDSEFFMIIHQIIDICKKIPDANWHVLVISAVSITFLVACKYLADRFWPFKRIPFPTELILLVAATIFSHFLKIHEKWNVSIIADIPTGFPPFHFPNLKLLPHLLSYALSIAVVAFAITVSMGKLFAKKHGYTIYPNQELLALGSVSVISSIFNVFPTSCSLSRTLVNEASGAKSQISGVIAAGITLIVILVVGPLLEDLPMCVLSSIVIVALRSLMMKVTELPPLYKISRIDAAVWAVTAISVLGYDIVEGLVAGVIVAVLSVIARSQWPSLHEMGRLPCGDFRVANRFSSAVPPFVPVIRFDAPLIFTNVERFKRAIRHEIHTLSSVYVSVPEKIPLDDDESVNEKEVQWDVVILDCSTWVYTDSMGIEAVKELILEMLNKNILVLFSEVRSAVLVQYRRAGLFDVASEDQFYPSHAFALAAAEKIRANEWKFSVKNFRIGRLAQNSSKRLVWPIK